MAVRDPLSAHDTEKCDIIRALLTRVGDRWSIVVVQALGAGSQRFSELQRTIWGISQRMLTLTLRNLERDGLVLRTVTPSIPPRVDYELTPLGQSFQLITATLGEWAITNNDDIEKARRIFDEKTL